VGLEDKSVVPGGHDVGGPERRASVREEAVHGATQESGCVSGPTGRTTVGCLPPVSGGRTRRRGRTMVDEASLTRHEAEPAPIGGSAASEVSNSQQGAGEDGDKDLAGEGQTEHGETNSIKSECFTAKIDGKEEPKKGNRWEEGSLPLKSTAAIDGKL
jgi:hypothetical protein